MLLLLVKMYDELTGENVRVIFIKGRDGSYTLHWSRADYECLQNLSHCRCIQHTHLQHIHHHINTVKWSGGRCKLCMY